jgi:hypothetical protein
MTLVGGSKRTAELRSALARCRLPNSERMENAMCWEMDYQFFAEQKKAQENKIKENQAKEEHRDKVIARLLDEAKVHGEKTQSEKTEEAPVKEVAPAK